MTLQNINNNIEEANFLDDYNQGLVPEYCDEDSIEESDSLDSLNLLDEETEELFIEEIITVGESNINTDIKTNIQKLYNPTDDFLSKTINFNLSSNFKLTNTKKPVSKLMVFLDTEYESDTGLSIQLGWLFPFGIKPFGWLCQKNLRDKVSKGCKGGLAFDQDPIKKILFSCDIFIIF
jgi:hypothetical protein